MSSISLMNDDVQARLWNAICALHDLDEFMRDAIARAYTNACQIPFSGVLADEPNALDELRLDIQMARNLLLETAAEFFAILRDLKEQPRESLNLAALEN